MSELKKDYINLPDELDYRGSSFYDLDEDIRSTECSSLYKRFTSLKSRYTEIEEIAFGGMKKIFRAYDQTTGRYIAIAKLKEDMPQEYTGPFIAEARLTAALQHPNIIKIHEIGFDEKDEPYFTMDLKLGDSMSEILGKLDQGDADYEKKYPRQLLLLIFLKVCDAVSYSHSQEILHLDIKPENIQIGEHGEVQLCDWGLARFTGEVETSSESFLDQDFLSGQTLDSEIKGTPGYLAPERITKKYDRSEQSDIYSLGAVLYSLLTFKRPFEGELDKILLNTVDGHVIPPKDRYPEGNIPDSLNAIVVKAMSTEPADRYGSVKDLIADINKHLDGFSTQAENAGLVKEISLFYKRNSRVCNLSFSFITLLFLIALLFINQLHKSRVKETNLRKAAELSQREAEENLQKYREEKEMTDLSFSTDPTAVLNVIKDSFFLDFCYEPNATVDRTMKTLSRITESNKSEILVYEFKGDLHFIRQEFDLSLQELKKGRGKEAEVNSYIFNALEAVEGYKSEGKPAPVEVIQKIFDNLHGKFNNLIVRMVIYDKKLRNNADEHFKLVKQAFMYVNKVKHLDEFTYDSSTKSLSIKGECKQLNFYFIGADLYLPLFSTLDVEHLILKSDSTLKATEIQGLNLKTLDLRGVKIINSKNFNPQGIAEKIYISESLVDHRILKKLLNVCTVIIEK